MGWSRGGASVADAATKIGLTSTVYEALDRSGRTPQGTPAVGLPPGTDVVSKAFSSDVGVESDPLPFENGFIWFETLGVTPSRERTLEEVKGEVEQRWREEQVAAKLRSKAQELVEKLRSGTPFADVAAASNLKLETATGVKRESAGSAPPSIVGPVFRAAKGDVGDTRGVGSEYVVWKLTDIVAPPVDLASDEAKKVKDTMKRAMGDEQVGLYVAAIESKIGVTINQAAVAQVTGASSSNN